MNILAEFAIQLCTDALNYENKYSRARGVMIIVCVRADVNCKFNQIFNYSLSSNIHRFSTLRRTQDQI